MNLTPAMVERIEDAIAKIWEAASLAPDLEDAKFSHIDYVVQDLRLVFGIELTRCSVCGESVPAVTARRYEGQPIGACCASDRNGAGA